MDRPAAVVVAGEYASGVEVGFVDADGVERSDPLASWWAVPFEMASLVRPFASFKGAGELHRRILGVDLADLRGL
ncbi:hypothetical protein ACQPZG_04815 (plasmid) [Streptomyces sp. CA-294286]|uniref:hypothetical protein n=1 Tax=Streptomyces sp. CA-294286 TaxID=3240070 RepID=UPI003D94A9A6